MSRFSYKIYIERDTFTWFYVWIMVVDMINPNDSVVLELFVLFDYVRLDWEYVEFFVIGA
jgi:hypothetical protein